MNTIGKTIKIEIILELPEDIDINIVKPKINPINSKLTESTIENIKVAEIDPSNNQKMTLTTLELSELIGISPSTIYTMARQNEIPHKKVRGRVLFHKPTIERWLSNQFKGNEE